MCHYQLHSFFLMFKLSHLWPLLFQPTPASSWIIPISLWALPCCLAQDIPGSLYIFSHLQPLKLAISPRSIGFVCLSRLYLQCGAWTHDPKIKSHYSMGWANQVPCIWFLLMIFRNQPLNTRGDHSYWSFTALKALWDDRSSIIYLIIFTLILPIPTQDHR